MNQNSKNNRFSDVVQSSRPIGSDGRWPTLGVCVFLAAVTLAVFGRTIGYGFAYYDDPVYVFENAQVTRGLTLKGIEWAFTHSVSANWHPLTMMSHMLDCQIYGLNAGGHHMTNVLLHAVTAILLFLVLRQMTGAFWRSAFVAAVFAIHPLRVESVVWVSERKDVLSGLFFMLTVGAYVRHVRRPFSPGRYLPVVFLFMLGLMSKPMLVTLPLVLLLLDYWPLGRFAKSVNEPKCFFIPRQLLLEKIPMFALAAVGCGVTLLAQHEAIMTSEEVPFPLRITNALVSYAVYLKQMFYPAKLALLYPLPKNGLPVWESFLALVFLTVVSGGVFVWRRKRPYLMVGWLWYLGMLVPVIGLVQVGLQAHADRYTYLPQIGLYVMVVWLVADLCAAWQYRRMVLGGTMAIVIAALTVCSRIQTAYWRDNELLWTHTLACTTNNALAHNGLGNVLAQKGRAPEAVEQYQKAVTIRPQFVQAWNNLGYALLQSGRVDEAIAQFQKALEIQPDFADADYNLGVALDQKGLLDEAIDQFRKTLGIQPDYPAAYNNLGNALLQKGNVDEAITCYQKALAIKPDDAKARYNLGSILAQQGRVDEAIAHFKRALEIKPEDAEVHGNLGNALLQKGQVDEAIAHFQKALEIKPDSAEAHYNLGNALLQKGQVNEATEQFQKALEIKPDSAEACYNLGNALFQRGRVDEAIVCYQKVLKIKPDHVETHINLGSALLQKKRVDEAVEQFQQAINIQPASAQAHYDLSQVLFSKGQLDEAIAHLEKALEIRPDYAKAHASLGVALLQKGRADEAITHFQEAVEIQPLNAEFHNHLGYALLQKGRLDEATAHLQEALKIHPDYPEAGHNLARVAWLLATSPEASVRNGAKAIALAGQVEQLSGGRDPLINMTLAAAYAEAGRFAEAIETAQHAQQLAAAQNNTALVNTLRGQIERYLAGAPFRDASQTNAPARPK